MITSTTQTAGIKPNAANCNLRAATTDTLPQPSVSYSYGVREGNESRHDNLSKKHNTSDQHILLFLLESAKEVI